jgi:hypothetical protein
MEVVYHHADAVEALPPGTDGAGQPPTAVKLLAALVNSEALRPGEQHRHRSASNCRVSFSVPGTELEVEDVHQPPDGGDETALWSWEDRRGPGCLLLGSTQEVAPRE